MSHSAQHTLMPSFAARRWGVSFVVAVAAILGAEGSGGFAPTLARAHASDVDSNNALESVSLNGGATSSTDSIHPIPSSFSKFCRPPGLRPGDEFWVIESRHLPSAAAGAPLLRAAVCRDQAWLDAELSEFLESDFGGVTVFYVHGNRCSACDGVAQGRKYYELISRRAREPMRMVLWSWPSDQIPGTLTDVRCKAARTLSEAYYLGWVLRRLPLSQRVGLIGYSFGARVIAGALHVAGGGAAAGIALTDEGPISVDRFHVVLLAAAFDYTWMCPGDCFACALVPAARMMITVNRKDSVLRHFRRLEPERDDRALGTRGLPCRTNSCRVQHVDVSGAIGRSHNEQSYLCNRFTVDRAAEVLLSAPAGPAS